MVHHSNSELLSGNLNQKQKKGKSNNISVVFDDKSRVEYLTGFQRRNKDKKKKYLEKQKETLRLEKTEKRREKRRKIREIITNFIKDDTTEESSPHLDTSQCKNNRSELTFVNAGDSTTVTIENLD